jgi:hypothetical protein
MRVEPGCNGPMKAENPFDQKIAHMKSIGSDQVTSIAFVRDAAIYVADTLELAWAAAQAVFEKGATPELALQIYDRVNAERLRLHERTGVTEE